MVEGSVEGAGEPPCEQRRLVEVKRPDKRRTWGDNRAHEICEEISDTIDIWGTDYHKGQFAGHVMINEEWHDFKVHLNDASAAKRGWNAQRVHDVLEERWGARVTSGDLIHLLKDFRRGITFFV